MPIEGGIVESMESTAIDVRRIAAMFVLAETHIEHPKIRLKTPDGIEVVITLAGERARYPGSINVAGVQVGAYRPFFGRIHTDGAFEDHCARRDVITLLQEFALTPEQVAAQHGILTGNCCFCGQTLTDPRSVAVGYGPVCAQTFGLAWGS